MNIDNLFDSKHTQEIAITTLFGLEDLLVDEIKLLGGKKVEKGNRVVHCEGDLQFIYKCCLGLRHALRVLLFVEDFEAEGSDDLYDAAYKMPWEDFIPTDKTFAIDFSVHSQYFNHSKYASLKLKDAIVDRIRMKTGHRPSINPKQPDFQLFLHISDKFVSIYLDAAGETLNKRGYREEAVTAPINEILAAGIVKLTGWDGTVPLLDGMCGSGTIPIEAVYQARNIPSQWYRTYYGFMTWSNYDFDLWKSVRDHAMKGVKPLETEIRACDISDVSLQATRINIGKARLEKYISTEVIPFQEQESFARKGIIIINPPYGERLMGDEINDFYKEIGDTLKNNFDGWDAWLITSNKEALKHLGLRTAKRIQLYNGPLETRLVHYPLYRGTRK